MQDRAIGISYQQTKDKMKLREWSFTGTIDVVELIDPIIDSGLSVCHALILTVAKTDLSSIVLWFIGTGKDHRRKGYAKKLVSYMQDVFDEITTQWNTDEGNSLMISCGFKRFGDKLMWKKEGLSCQEQDAKKAEENTLQ